MVAALRASGLSIRAFAQQHGLGTHRVSYWRAKLAGGTGSGAGFVAVSVAADSGSGLDERSVEVTLRNGRTLALRGDWDETAIRPWLDALEATP